MKPVRISKKMWILIAVALAVAAGALYIVYATRGESAKQVSVTELAPKQLKKTVTLSGVVESKRVENVADNSGMIVWEILKPVGSRVDRGDALATLYDKDKDEWKDVTATIDGVVTSVNTVNGTPAAGVLFTLQDDSTLQVRATARQNQLESLAFGDAVKITPDGISGKSYDGTVVDIAPVANTTTGAETAQAKTATEPEFDVLISITSATDGLKIGMKTKDVVDCEVKDNVFAVPIDSVILDEGGNNAVYVLQDTEDGTVVKKIPVQTGITTDSEIEITAPELKGGMKVIKTPLDVTEDERADAAPEG